jgi:MFS family permease
MVATRSTCSEEDVEKNAHGDTDVSSDEHGTRAWPRSFTGEVDMERPIKEEAEEQQRPTDEATRPSGLVATLSRTISRRSAASSWQDPGPPPDGGLQAWTQVFCVHMTILTTFGYMTSFGVFQTYYQNTLDVSPSTISWIGSVQLFLLFGIGTFSGRATDAGLFKPVYVAGAVFQMIGIFGQAQATTFWQLFLAQALCIGIANGLQFCPALALISTYFARKRAFAMGIAAVGSCTGGIVFPIIVQQLLPRAGYAWTVRVIGFLMLFSNVIAITFLRTRLPPRKSGPLVEWGAFKEAPYTLYCVAMFFNFWGLYFVFFYIGSYGRNVLGVSYQESINLLLTIVAVGILFRLLPNYFADRIGSLNTLIPFCYLCGILMFGWIGIRSTSGLYVFGAIYGCGSACIQGLWPATIASLNKVPDMKKAGIRMGMAFSVVSIACLTGAPLGGALIQQRGGDYLYAQIWGGMCFFIGATLLVVTRWSVVGWDPKGRI